MFKYDLQKIKSEDSQRFYCLKSSCKDLPSLADQQRWLRRFGRTPLIFTPRGMRISRPGLPSCLLSLSPHFGRHRIFYRCGEGKTYANAPKVSFCANGQISSCRIQTCFSDFFHSYGNCQWSQVEIKNLKDAVAFVESMGDSAHHNFTKSGVARTLLVNYTDLGGCQFHWRARWRVRVVLKYQWH